MDEEKRMKEELGLEILQMLKYIRNGIVIISITLLIILFIIFFTF